MLPSPGRALTHARRARGRQACPSPGLRFPSCQWGPFPTEETLASWLSRPGLPEAGCHPTWTPRIPS